MRERSTSIITCIMLLMSVPLNIHGQTNDGFQVFRQALGEEYHSAFKNQKADLLRNALKNTMIRFESVGSYGDVSVGGGSSYDEIIVFCADGTFSYYNLSSSSIGGSDFGGYSRGNINFQGVWEVFTEHGMVLIGLYSQDPYVLQHNSKGFIPMLVQSYASNALSIASEGSIKIYRKSNHPCQLGLK